MYSFNHALGGYSDDIFWVNMSDVTVWYDTMHPCFTEWQVGEWVAWILSLFESYQIDLCYLNIRLMFLEKMLRHV